MIIKQFELTLWKVFINKRLKNTQTKDDNCNIDIQHTHNKYSIHTQYSIIILMSTLILDSNGQFSFVNIFRYADTPLQSSNIEKIITVNVLRYFYISNCNDY